VESGRSLADASDWYDVVVIGAGAAGLVAAAEAAERGLKTLLVEKNRRPGVKILMSGGTRCNLTQSTDKWGIVKAYGAQGNFLHSALAALSPAELVQLIEDEGVPTKVEETGKIFPVSNHAADVLDALLKRLQRSGAELALEEPVTAIERAAETASECGFRVVTARRELAAASVIVTVGGQSYPGSGTRGDGYAWAAALGHTIVPPRPALVPLTAEEPWVRELSGVTIPDVAVELFAPGPDADALTPALSQGEREKREPPKPLDRRRGSLLFTHFGLSGPVILDISRAYTALAPAVPGSPPIATLVCDFLPDVKAASLDDWLRQAAAGDGKRLVAGILAERLPKRLVEALLTRAGVAADLRGAALSKPARAALVQAVKATPVAITGSRGFAKAEVTAGGVALDEIDSRTMESKLVPGLYFAGEILDLDGPIGGYNFQAAFSTGVLAGRSVT
jgi:predicted Rossmann fold flavoprotein